MRKRGLGPKFLVLAQMASAVVALFCLPIVASVAPLRFPDAYSAEGMIYLPYGDIAEPFEAWVDFQSGNSRLDTYNGEKLKFKLATVSVDIFLTITENRAEGDKSVNMLWG